MKKMLTLIVVALVTISVHATQNYKDAVSTGTKELKEKNYDAAVIAFDAAAELTEKPLLKADAYMKAAKAIQRTRDYDKADEYFRKVLALENSSAAQKSAAQYEIGFCYYSQRKYPETITEMKKVLSMEKVHKNHIVLAKLFTGYSLYQTKEYAAAVEHLKELYEDESVHPNYRAGALIYLGHINRERRQYAEAISDYAKVKDIAKINLKVVADADNCIGDIYYVKTKDYNKAKTIYMKVVADTNASLSAKKHASTILRSIEQLNGK